MIFRIKTRNPGLEKHIQNRHPIQHKQSSLLTWEEISKHLETFDRNLI